MIARFSVGLIVVDFARGQNLQMKFCLRSPWLFVYSVDVLSNHLLAIPSKVRGNTSLSVGPPEKEIFRNSLRSCPLTSNVELSGWAKLFLVLFSARARNCSKVRVSISTSSVFDSDDSDS
ncbi:hypothetical protein Tco_1294507 [Tanacetum coccineum]